MIRYDILDDRYVPCKAMKVGYHYHYGLLLFLQQSREIW